jgi:GT2 family glycosyltransferase
MKDSRLTVSIVTPSLNCARFLEQAIESVLSQDYPSIQYRVMDGGSTDGSIEILKRYEGRLQFVSQKDQGQADAVNRGFAQCSGAVFTFLNADDILLPGAVTAAVRGFEEHPDAAVVYGGAFHAGPGGERIGAYPVEDFDRANLGRRCFICQPAAFMRSSAFAAAGMLDPTLQFSLDYDLWARLAQHYGFARVRETLAASRLHPDAKTVAQTAPAMRETLGVLQRHFGYVPFNWLYGYCHHRLTGQPIAAAMPRPKLTSAFYSAAVGARYNWRHPLRYLADIASTAREGLAWAGR